MAVRFAALVAECRAQGRRPGIMDAWIAATAIRHGIALCTQDDDFDGSPGLQVLKV